jgi:hypothetical protein
VIALTVDERGRSVGAVTGLSEELDLCVAAQVRTWSFTPPTRGVAPAVAHFSLTNVLRPRP